MQDLNLNYFRKKASSHHSNGLLNILLTIFDHLRENIKTNAEKNIKEYSLNSNLKLIKKQGYSIIPNFVNAKICADFQNEIDLIIKKHSEYLHKNIDDLRIYGAENLSSKINSFSSNSYLRKIASAYNHTQSYNAFSLAAKLPYMPNNKGSGGGWHRDSCIMQFKALLYLSDVTEKNGPFQIIARSNNLKAKLFDNMRTNQPYMGYRYTDNQVEEIIARDPNRLISFCEPAGTLILVDTSCIHRGKPIEEGIRYSLFNYYYPVEKITDALFNQFAPVARL